MLRKDDSDSEAADLGLLRLTQPSWRYESSIAPVVASILGILAWAVFILLYALFWSNGFSLFQNVIVTIVSLIIAGLLIGLMWVVWGSKGEWRGGKNERARSSAVARWAQRPRTPRVETCAIFPGSKKSPS